PTVHPRDLVGRTRADLAALPRQGVGAVAPALDVLSRSESPFARAAAHARGQDEHGRLARRTGPVSGSQARGACPGHSERREDKERRAQIHPEKGRARTDSGCGHRPSEAGFWCASARVVPWRTRPAGRTGTPSLLPWDRL